MVAYIGLLVKLCASFPLISMATRNSLYHSVGWDPDKLPFWKHCVVVVSLAVAALLFGLFIPSINMVFGFIGSFCGGATGFLLPSILMMYGGNWSLRSVGWAHYTITYALLFAGVVMVVFGTGATSTALWRETECGAVWSSGTIAHPWTPASVWCASAGLCCGIGHTGCNVRQAVPSP
ncbi:putative amino acid transporter [Trypanosoma cruzi]|uniref:Putative amino acid transporter n=1 Tax=Trypanosoma cruzi TaxID=5693 RepID=A0A2V2UQ13_TRYCR|nr:putative amino acid transporter [Trypanosoma cruzi]